MQTKQTIAIIGGSENIGSTIFKNPSSKKIGWYFLPTKADGEFIHNDK